MTDNMNLQELKEQFSGVSFWQHLGCEIAEVEPGSSVVTLQVKQQHLNSNGTVHGGVYASLADNAMGLASRAAAGRYQATTQMNLHFLAAINEGTIIAMGRVVHRTKRTVTTEARLEAEDGTLLAIATGAFRVFPPPADK